MKYKYIWLSIISCFMQASCEKPQCDCPFTSSLPIVLVNQKGEDITNQVDQNSVKLTRLNSDGQQVQLINSCGDKALTFMLNYQSGPYRLDLGNGVSKQINVTFKIFQRGCCKGTGELESVQVEGKRVEGDSDKRCGSSKTYAITI